MEKAKSCKVAVFLALAVGIIAALIVGYIGAEQIHATSTVEFCNSCHEMNIFHEAWAAGPHGPNAKGIIVARCVDCHLPHDSLSNYLIVKTKAGIHDVIAHKTGKKTEWLKLWKNRGPYYHEAYESGCLECHRDIIAPGIPVKALTAHKTYLAGQSERDCLDCHYKVGHGDLVQIFLNTKRKEGE